MIRIEVGIPGDEGDGFDFQALGQLLGQSAKSLAIRYPAWERWQILKKVLPSRYNILSASGERRKAVLAVGRDSNRLQPKQIVQVGYYDRDRKWAYILAGVGFGDWEARRVGVVLVDWVSCLANPGLTGAALKISNAPNLSGGRSSLMNYLGHPPLLLARWNHPALGPCVTATYFEGGAILIRGAGLDGSELFEEALATGLSSSSSGVADRLGQGHVYPPELRAVGVPQLNEAELSKSAFYKVLAGEGQQLASDRKLFCANFLNDYLVRGDFRRIQDLSQTSIFPPAPDTITFSDATPVRDLVGCKGASVLWEVNPKDIAGNSRACPVPVAQNAEHNRAFSINMEMLTASLFVASGTGLDPNSVQDVGLAYGFAPASVINPLATNPCGPGNYNGLFRTLEAWMAWLDLASGAVTKALLETNTHQSPPQDSAICTVWSDYLEAHPQGGFPAPFGGITYQFQGQAAWRSILTELVNNTLEIYSSNFLPDTATSARPVALPLPTRVHDSAPPVSQVDQWVRMHWEDAPSESTPGTVDAGLRTYAAYLMPHSYGGWAQVGNIRSITLRNEAGDTTIEGIPYYDWLLYFVPTIWRHWTRTLVIFENKVEIGRVDLSQMMRIYGFAPSGFEVESSGTYGFPDNIWAVCPIGRVIFVLLDYRFENDSRKEAVPYLATIHAETFQLLTLKPLYVEEFLEEDVHEDPEDPGSPVVYEADWLRWNHYSGRPQMRVAVGDSGAEWALISLELRDRANGDVVHHHLIKALLDVNHLEYEPGLEIADQVEGEELPDWPTNSEFQSVVLADNKLYWARENESLTEINAI